MKFKKLLMCAAASACCITALAVPAKRGERVMTQPDGSTITLQLVGDERFHTYATADGLAVEKNTDGFFHYRDAQGITPMRATDAARRGAEEKTFIDSNRDRISLGTLMKKGSAAAKTRRAAAKAPALKASQVPNQGSARVPVILVQYKDVKFKDADPNKTFTEFFSSGDTSARQYFIDQSNGKYQPEFDVYGPFTLAGNRTTYGGNDYYGDDKGIGRMVGEGCLGLDSEIDFSDYDNDGDGECDVVIVLYAGVGEASSDEEDAVWPCQWELASSDYGRNLTLDGTLISKFAVFNELNGTYTNKIDGVGTFCHEFSHCLGLPDFYDTDYENFGMAHWSLMDYGCYNDDGYLPIGYSAYEKAFMGWIDIEEAKENTLYNLPVFNQKNGVTDKAVMLTSSRNKNEYFIIENRAKQGWDAEMLAEGLLITHVNYSASAWNNNTVNTGATQRMTPVPADNELKMDRVSYWGETYYTVNEESVKGDLWPYNGNNELTDTSAPAAQLASGGYLGKPVTEITRNADGTISFWTMKAPVPGVASPANVSHSVKSPTSLEITWEAGDENDVTYTVEVKEHLDITYELVGSYDFSNNDHGWTTTGYTEADANNGGTRLGSGNQLGTLTSPEFTTADDGIVTVKVNAKYYSGDESQMRVSLLDSNGIAIDSETFQLTASYADYTALLEGTPSGKVSVRIETIAKKKRIYAGSADIYTGDATEESGSRAANKAADRDIRVTEGLTGTSYLAENLKEGGTYDYRVKAVPTDTNSFGESNWSETRTATLDGESGVTEIKAGEDAADAEYYTLQGIRISAPTAAGIYILRRGDRSCKIRIR